MYRFFAGLLASLLVSHLASAQTQQRSLIVGGAVRDYLLFVPDGVAGHEKLPLVVMLHGGGAPSELMVLYSRFNDLARRERIAVAYPRGIGRWWNDGRLGSSQAESSADDVGFIRALVAEVGAALPIDRSRIFAAGISNGGFMSLRLACEASDIFSAIAPVAASMPAEVGARCRPARPVAVLVINGTADAFVPYVGGYARTAATLRGAIWSTDRTAAFWAAHNRCAGPAELRVLPDRDPNDGSHVIEAEHRSCIGAPVKVLRIEGGGHTWPGGVQGLPESWIGSTNRDIDASEVIWDFFKTAAARRPLARNP